MEICDINRQFVTESYDENGELSDVRLMLPDNFNFAYDVIDAIAAIEPDRRAMIWCDDEGRERIFTYGEFSALSNRAANFFAAQGIKKGDRIMTVLKRHWQMWIVTYALEKIGAILIPATNMLKKKDYTYRFTSGKIDGVIATGDGDVMDEIEAACTEYDGIRFRLSVKCPGNREGWISFDDNFENCSADLERVSTLADEDSLMFFSSGTTGYPKMVVHSHTYSAAHIPTAKYWHRLTENSIHLTVSESGWGKFFWGKIFGQTAMAATVLAYDFTKFVPSDVLKVIEKYKVTSLCCPPTIYRFLIKEGMEGFDLSSLESAATAGEALNAEVFDKFREYTGLPLREGFGQTETVLLIASLTDDGAKAGLMGKAMPMFDVIIADEDGNECAEGTVGEICVRLKESGNYGLFKEYFGNDEATRSAFRGGLFHTGDTALMENGYFRYVGRVDDVIKSSGYRIGPFEIESVLMEHPAVLEAAVTAAPDEVRGQVVKATIILTSAYKDKAGKELAKELQTYVKDNTAPYKYPRIVEFVDELPKTISGKIRRAAIRETDKNSHMV